MLGVKINVDHEKVVVATGYFPFRRAAIPFLDTLTVLNMECPEYIIFPQNIGDNSR